ncbi:MAG: methylated-DNA--[protein]-cysteine S-methyltransferase [Leptolyngbyaceae cyanobacterium bins.59]|nr:methylated-DNA--[protein]-cysteine S-methyltransferase [Leptolyngbyaceae cyanobacterium bins.59]
MPSKKYLQDNPPPIRYGISPSNLGWILVAATDQGVCAIHLQDSREGAIEQLQARFPATPFRPEDPDCDRWAAEVAAFVEMPQHTLDFPLDLQGTAFQKQVWQALRAIPCGTTLTYLALSEHLGNPKAVRAVARACALNEIAVAIPCHRVVGSNGALTGYRWGLDRKRILLQREANCFAQPEVEQLTLSLL